MSVFRPSLCDVQSTEASRAVMQYLNAAAAAADTANTQKKALRPSFT